MRTTRNNERGALTLVALCLTAVIGIALGSYVALCYQSLNHSTRQFNLNRARQLAETGIEEALWALNNSDNWTAASWGALVDADGDSVVADRQKTFTGYTFDSGVTGQVVVKVINSASDAPTIIATATITTTTSGSFTKTLTATTKTAPYFVNAIGILDGNNGRVLFNSNGTVDSWLSDPDGDYNVASGTPKVDYATPTYTLGNNCAAVIAAPNITLNSATVYGYAATFGNSITTTGSSKIKGPGPTVPNIDSTRVNKSAFVPNLPVAAPTGSYDSTTVGDLAGGATQTIGTVGASTATQYSVSDLTLTDAGTILKIQGPVVLKVTGYLHLYYAAKIQVLSTGRLELFVTGDVLIGGAAGSTARFQNDTNEAKNLAVYSTNTGSRTFTYYSTQDFCGVMYSASTNAKVEIQSSPKIYGAIVANYNVEFDAGTTPVIHYDLALRTQPKNWFKGVTTTFLIQQITES